MKKRILFVLGAFAVLGLSACVEQQEVNPNFDPVTKTVNTQFVLNIAAADGATPQTKQSSEVVQDNKVFRGMNDATLYAFKDIVGDGKKLTTLSLTDEAANMFRLPQALTPSVIVNPNMAGNRILNLSLTEGVNSVLFYGLATKSEVDQGLNPYEVYGSLQYGALDEDGNVDDALLGSVISFPGRIYSRERRRVETTAEKTAIDNIETIITCVLHGLVRMGFNGSIGGTATVWDNTTFGQTTVGGITLNLTGHRIHWKDYADAIYDAEGNFKANPKSPVDGTTDLQELERMLGTAYKSFVTIKSTEHRSGSGFSLQRQLTDLYAIVSAGATSTPYNSVEVAAVKMSEIIRNYLDDFFEKEQNTSTNVWELTWKSTSAVRQKLQSTYNGNYGMVLPTSAPSQSISTFPTEFHLPLGCVTIEDKTPSTGGDGYPVFRYDTGEDLGTEQTTAQTTVYSYAYPTELAYYCNSPLRISNSPGITDASYPQWSSSNKKAWYDWTLPSGSTAVWFNETTEINKWHVTSETRGVAVKYPVEYGVALLKSQVMVASKDLYDNNKLFNPTEDNKKITMDGSTSYLTWSGVLVGGQPDRVDWRYMRLETANAEAGFNTIVYDKVKYRQKTTTIPAATEGGDPTTVYSDEWGEILPYTTGGKSSYNFTLLYDNYDSELSDDGQSKVRVALEFVNNLNTDFWGQDNIVRDGGTFYLIAEIDPSNAASTFVNFKENSMLPPYVLSGNDAGETKNVVRAFMGDYVTTINFTLPANALQHAYVTVPDLRSAKLSLGLQVDIEWTEGITYDVTLGQ